MDGGAPVGTAFVDILPKMDAFASSLVGQMKTAIAKASGTVDASPLVQGLNAGLLALGAVAIAGIYKGIKATQDWAKEVTTLKRVTGQTAEEASKLAGVASILGINTTQMGSAFSILSQRVSTGSSALTKYGIETRDATGAQLPLFDVLQNIQGVISALPPGMQQSAAASALFGSRMGRNLLPMLTLTKDQMAALMQQAEDLGLVLSQEDLDATRDLTRAQASLGLAFKGLSISLGKTFIPALTTATNFMVKLVETINKIPRPVLAAGAMILGLNTALTAIGAVYGLFADKVKVATAALAENTLETQINDEAVISSQGTQLQLAGAVDQTVEAIDAQTTASISNVAATESAIPAQLAAAGATTVMAGQTALFAVTADVATASTGFFAGALSALSGALATVGTTLSALFPPAALIRLALIALTFIIIKNWGTIKQWISAIVTAVAPAFRAMGAAIRAVVQYIASKAGPVIKFFSDLWRQLGQAFGEFMNSMRELGAALSQSLGPVLNQLKPLLPLIGKALLVIVGAFLALIGTSIVAFLKLTEYGFKALAIAVHVVAVVIEAVVNFIIDGINLLIAAWNKLDALPGIDLGGQVAPLEHISIAASEAAASTTDLANANDKASRAAQRHLEAVAAMAAPLADHQEAVDALSAGYGKWGDAISEFATTSGQDLSQVQTDLQTMLADPTKATGDQVLGVIASMKSAWASWHDSIVEAFGGAGSALEKFLGKANVDLGKAIASLKQYTAQLRDYGNDFAEINKRYGEDAKSFLAWAQSKGLETAGLLNKLADAPKKVGDAFFEQWKRGEGATDTLASSIQNALEPVFSKIMFWLKNVVRAIRGLPPLHLDNTQAMRALDELLAHANYVNQQIAAGYHPPGGRPDITGGGRWDNRRGGRGGNDKALGGLIRAFARGGSTDTVPAMLTPGEFVFRRAAVQRIGVSALKRMNDGGMVGTGSTAWMRGELRIRDWRSGLASLESELEWNEAVSYR